MANALVQTNQLDSLLATCRLVLLTAEPTSYESREALDKLRSEIARADRIADDHARWRMVLRLLGRGTVRDSENVQWLVRTPVVRGRYEHRREEFTAAIDAARGGA